MVNIRNKTRKLKLKSKNKTKYTYKKKTGNKKKRGKKLNRMYGGVLDNTDPRTTAAGALLVLGGSTLAIRKIIQYIKDNNVDANVINDIQIDDLENDRGMDVTRHDGTIHGQYLENSV